MYVCTYNGTHMKITHAPTHWCWSLRTGKAFSETNFHVSSKAHFLCTYTFGPIDRFVLVPFSRWNTIWLLFTLFSALNRGFVCDGVGDFTFQMRTYVGWAAYVCVTRVWNKENGMILLFYAVFIQFRFSTLFFVIYVICDAAD
jgi:hypothetical protein